MQNGLRVYSGLIRWSRLSTERVLSGRCRCSVVLHPVKFPVCPRRIPQDAATFGAVAEDIIYVDFYARYAGGPWE